MKISKILLTKAKQIRKQNWSAPATMSVFIIICMIIVFSFESMGLANKERNLEFRHTTAEKSINIFIKLVIRTFSEEKFKETKVEISQENIQNKLIEKLRDLSERNKEESLEKMYKILAEGANIQQNYEKDVDVPSKTNTNFEQEFISNHKKI